MRFVCEVCGKIFEDFPARKRKYCSRKCFYARPKGGRVIRICKTCGKVFEIWAAKTKMKRGFYCSKKCMGIGFSKSRSTYITCQVCGKSFNVPLSEEKRRITCSIECFQKYRKSKFWEIKNCEECGKAFTYYKPHRKMAKYCSRKCARVALIKSQRFVGKRNPSYKGVYKSAREFRRVWGPRLRKLWGDKCFICGWAETPNDICHITPVKEGGENKIENVVLLCPNHHRMLDLGLIQREHLASLAQKQRLDTSLVSQHGIAGLSSDH